ncbi:hypothetical protein DV737_g4783, partial [Chaetothyriales sp. CBS 132003]
MAEQLPTDPVRLPGFPSCQNSLAWGGEHLAVSAGDTVHILTPAYTNPSSWHTESVRVNRFSDLEWPHQELTALDHLSIGEEQSQSRVVSLAWSPPGLGLHQRSVLAVLTSNLVLSLWESNGKPGTWRRALVVRDHIHNEEANFAGSKHRSQRIRAFTWLPPLTHANAAKWGTHLLAVVNDNNLLSCFHVRRPSDPQDAGYEMKKVYHHQLPSATEPLEASDEMSPLEALLIKEARVCRIVAGSWQEGHEHEEYPECFRIRLTLVRGADGGPPPNDAFIVQVRPTAAGVVVEGATPTPAESAPRLGDQSVVANAGLRKAVDASVQEFNEKHHLQGHVRVRYWGQAADPTGKYVSACITLHPSSMLESVHVLRDNILLLLAATTEHSVRNPTQPNAEQAIRRILSWVKAHTSDDSVKSELDVKLLRTVAGVILSVFSQDGELTAWARAAEPQMLRPAAAVASTATSPLTLHNPGPAALAKASTTSSPADPSYDPFTQSFRPEQDEEANLPAIPVSEPNELSSFLDLDSSSDEETPTIQRASSAQVGRPHIVRNAPHAQASKEMKTDETDWSFTAEEELVPVTASIIGNRADTLARLEGIELRTGKEVPLHHAALLPLPASPPATKEDDDTFSFSKTPIDYIAAGGRAKAKRDGLGSNPVSNLDKSILHFTVHPGPPPKQNRSRITMNPDNAPSLFDDQALFAAIRGSYHKHLATFPRCMPTPRMLTHATIGPCGKCVDGSDFAAHLLNPSLGRNRKDWLNWLLIALHYSFNLQAIALAALALVLLAATTTVAWVLFG